jgi:hypothetical protein
VSSIASGSNKRRSPTPGQENGDRRNFTELNALNNSIVQMENGPDKVSRARVVALLRRAGGLVRAHHNAIEAASAAFTGFDHIDDPRLELLTRAQLIAHYRSQMHLFEPTPAANVRLVDPIRAPRDWRAAVVAGSRSRQSVDSNRPPSSRDPRQDDGSAPRPSIERT